MDSITCKFGGTSLADADAVRAAVAIIHADPRRRFIVPSAPGKRNPEDKKVTDLLLSLFHTLRDDRHSSESVATIKRRFRELVEDLDSTFDVEGEIDAIVLEAGSHSEPDFLASRGEYLNGRILADLLDATFVDPSEYVRFDREGVLDESTYEILGRALEGDGLFVIPGFYGADAEGHVFTFSRGGSDVTGSLVARASGSILYENWTDVSGIRMTDPRIVPEARLIEEITYGELRELAYMGASVVHDEAIFPLRPVGIPMNIRNTRAPDDPGTMIVAEREPVQPVCGIAGRSGFTMINIEKTMMNREVGFALRALTVLAEHGVSFEHMPSGIDTISLIVKNEELKQHGRALVEGIDEACDPDRVWLTPNIALIATVGEGMNHHVGVAARLCGALAKANVNVRVLDQGSSEMNIIVGVDEADMEAAVRAIYHAFEDWN